MLSRLARPVILKTAKKQNASVILRAATLKYSTESKTEASAKETVQIPLNEKVVGAAQKTSFKTETKRLLDIVANSLYSEKEVFVRELVSNAADALEKSRYLASTGAFANTDNSPLAINIYLDKEKSLFIIQDNGVGMTKEELEENLGTIALSGSRKFLEKVNSSGTEKGSQIIGSFGVGFYSSFMVGDFVEVYSRNADSPVGYCWRSNGLGGDFEIAEAENVAVGTKVVIHLKEKEIGFADPSKVEGLIKKYSNFVGFPINVNTKQSNTISALWTRDKSAITHEEYNDFYKFISNDPMDPKYILHYSTDSPLQIRSLLFIPNMNPESIAMRRLEPGVSLYCRKVMIKAKAEEILPHWLRFVRGVVDSEDIPLNLSREMLQNSLLIGKIKRLLTKRVIKLLEDEAKNQPEEYAQFYSEFGLMIKEGLCNDVDFKNDIAKLLRYESSHTKIGSLTSLQEYVDRMTADQKEIIYLEAPSREAALTSPYYEPFKQKGIEVLFMYDTFDGIVATNLGKFGEKDLVTAEAAGAKIQQEVPSADGTSKNPLAAQNVSKEDSDKLIDWMSKALDKTVYSVKMSNRVTSHPALVVDHMSSSYLKLMKMMKEGVDLNIPVNLELNGNHPVILGLNALYQQDAEKAILIAEQVRDNAKINAGLLQDPRTITARLNQILELAVNGKIAKTELRPEEPQESKSDTQ